MVNAAGLAIIIAGVVGFSGLISFMIFFLSILEARTASKLWDLTNWKTSGIFRVVDIDVDPITNEWARSNGCEGELLVREKSMFGRGKQFAIKTDDYMEVENKSTGQKIVVAGLSTLDRVSLLKSKQYYDAMVAYKNKYFATFEENSKLKNRVDELVNQEIESLGKLHQKVAPIFLKKAMGGGGSK